MDKRGEGAVVGVVRRARRVGKDGEWCQVGGAPEGGAMSMG